MGCARGEGWAALEWSGGWAESRLCSSGREGGLRLSGREGGLRLSGREWAALERSGVGCAGARPQKEYELSCLPSMIGYPISSDPVFLVDHRMDVTLLGTEATMVGILRRVRW